MVPLVPTKTRTRPTEVAVPKRRAAVLARASKHLVLQPKPCYPTGSGQSCALEERVERARTDPLPPGKLSPHCVGGLLHATNPRHL